MNITAKNQYEELFLEMHPGFFDRDYIKRVPADEAATEMLLMLDEFDYNIYSKSFGKEVTFGYFHGDIEKLKEDVARVVPHWTQFFGEDSRIFCGFINGEVVCFCQIEDFGEHKLGDKTVKIGGPGCVGTLPEYRDRGLGLTMVKEVTQILKEDGYDCSYIHYTYETGWYSKLGYKKIVSWCGEGFV